VLQTGNERTCAYFNRPSSGSARRAHVAEELEREPTMSIVASSRIGRANPQSSIELARTSLPPPCFSVICLSNLPPRPVGPMMRFEVSSRLRPYSRPRVPPQGAVGLHRSSVRSPPDRRKRPRFIPSLHHKGTRRPLSVNTSSTIASPETPVMTSTNAAGVGVMTARLEAITCTEVGVITAQRITVYLLSHRTLESSARPSAGPSYRSGFTSNDSH
jgi:hypothetical protein